jgi:hypothetical protein
VDGSASDNPDAPAQGTYAYDNVWHDAKLLEWDEPAHDLFQSLFMRWDAAAETKLDNEQAQKAIDFEFRIHEQNYYNFTGVVHGTVPWSGVDPDNFIEENACNNGQGCTEVDIDLQDPSRITDNINYWLEIEIDAERNPTTTRPDFVNEVEYCDNDFVSNCRFDATAWFRKKLVVR